MEKVKKTKMQMRPDMCMCRMAKRIPRRIGTRKGPRACIEFG